MLNPKILAFSIACTKASTLGCCPVPEAISGLLQKQSYWIWCFLQIFEAKIKS
jgi:hypothetical protein